MTTQSLFSTKILTLITTPIQVTVSTTIMEIHLHTRMALIMITWLMIGMPSTNQQVNNIEATTQTTRFSRSMMSWIVETVSEVATFSVLKLLDLALRMSLTTISPLEYVARTAPHAMPTWTTQTLTVLTRTKKSSFATRCAQTTKTFVATRWWTSCKMEIMNLEKLEASIKERLATTE